MMTPGPREEEGTPCRRAACTAASFCAGDIPACTSAMPSWRPILAAALGESPVSMSTRSASAPLGAPERHAPLASAPTAAAELARTRSANVNTLRPGAGDHSQWKGPAVQRTSRAAATSAT